MDAIIYNVEKLLRDQGGKISGPERREVENQLDDAKEALNSNDKAQMDQGRERLTQASHKLAEQMYSKAQPQSTADSATGSGGPNAKPAEGVIDAEYVDVEENKSA